MEISVIIPTYKPKQYIYECLSSLLNQTLSRNRFEIIVVLNGCTSPWLETIEDYVNNQLKGLNVIIINTEVGGVSNARNIGLNSAHGTYVTFIDDDDYVSPSYLEELLTFASRDTISLCYPVSFKDGTSNFEPYYITYEYEKNADLQSCHYTKARRFFSGPVYKLIHRDIIGNRRFDTSFSNGEDSIFMFLISDRYNNVAFTSRHAIYYRRIREGSAETKHKSAKKIVINGFRMIVALTKIYFRRPFSYRISFYLGKVGGSVHWIVEQIKNNSFST